MFYEAYCQSLNEVFEQVQLELRTHIQEERLEREQYYMARAKAADRPDKYLSIIIDAMDQKKNKTELSNCGPHTRGHRQSFLSHFAFL
jgi:hypothetical protein